MKEEKYFVVFNCICGSNFLENLYDFLDKHTANQIRYGFLIPKMFGTKIFTCPNCVDKKEITNERKNG